MAGVCVCEKLKYSLEINIEFIYFIVRLLKTLKFLPLGPSE